MSRTSIWHMPVTLHWVVDERTSTVEMRIWCLMHMVHRTGNVSALLNMQFMRVRTLRQCKLITASAFYKEAL